MIEQLRGRLILIETETITVDVQGVGYLIYCGNPYRFQEWMDEEITVYTCQHVREDAIRLYGFRYREERRLFEKMLQVSGIGPKGALAIATSEQPGNIVEAIESENEKFLVKFPGVGKKTARQMILDLQGKLGDLLPGLQDHPKTRSDAEPMPVDRSTSAHPELDEAMEALKALGYVERELNRVKPILKQEDLSTDAYIRRALQELLKL
ncbi:Holliday junction branch migration protein RuvA [Salisediminibacterium beveridgei]|uniref:Holliday junction branch migration complex subunit RuvA n=1 Tax=Salisediminibacterium beveridgei TaxID=632773 RepID=A0A1D7QU21_9BACI|nr:Holliday junction branch migration protein RuvA [Salisediminibacterium beveridgei]AOM82475.1 Holliday junction DNA helicase RuvA [Salisediminibacterium beveridgei]